jgi:hypothetical protein
MQIDVVIDALDLKRLILIHLREVLGDLKVELADIDIQVKSKQNYKSEWEPADFRATFRKFDASGTI